MARGKLKLQADIRKQVKWLAPGFMGQKRPKSGEIWLDIFRTRTCPTPNRPIFTDCKTGVLCFRSGFLHLAARYPGSPERPLKVRCIVTLKGKNEDLANRMESADRRLFLRNAMRIGGAAALLLTSASRQMLASSLTLNAQDLEAARRAQQAPHDPNRDARVQEARTERSMGCTACEGGCSGACTGGCTSCTGCSGCTSSCASGCSGGCSGGCHGGCSGHCSGCSGVNL